MKTLLALSILIAVVAYVSAEQCTVNSNCVMTTCSNGYHVICEHSHEDGTTTNGGFCVCAVNNFQCSLRQDCLAPTLGLNCDDRRKHCYDGKCICSRF